MILIKSLFFILGQSSKTSSDTSYNNRNYLYDNNLHNPHTKRVVFFIHRLFNNFNRNRRSRIYVSVGCQIKFHINDLFDYVYWIQCGFYSSYFLHIL